MGEEETVSQAPDDDVANGTSAPEKSGGAVADAKEEVKDGVDVKSNREKTETENMGNESGLKEGKAKQEENTVENVKEKDAAKIEACEEINGQRRDEEIEEKGGSVEFVEEKADGLEGKGKVVEEEKGVSKKLVEEKADGLEEKEKGKGVEEEKGASKELVEEKADGLKEERKGVEKEKGKKEGEEKEEEEAMEVEKHEKEAEEEVKEEKEKAVQKKEKGSKKRTRGKVAEETKTAEGKIEKKKKVVETKKEPEPRTPAIERPQRERKSVERLVASMERDASKEFHISKGPGTPLKDIPNVAFKLSRRKLDDSFKLLHTILFGRRAKAALVKSNILRFSGFVWSGSEEKHMSKVKEKFDKCNKEKLLEFCDLFDVPIAKSSTKKEDLIAKLTEFLVAPHATTTVLLSEKEKASKSNKRKRAAKRSSRSSSSKSRRRAENGLKTTKKSRFDSDDESEEENNEEEEEEEEENEIEKEEDAEEDNDNDLPEKSDATPELSDVEKDESEEESEEDTKKRKNRKPPQKNSANKTRTNKARVSKKTSSVPKRTPKKSSSKRSEVDNEDDEEEEDATPKALPKKRRSAVDKSDAAPKVVSKKKSEMVAKKSSTPKSAPKEKAGKRAAKGKEKLPLKEKSQPSDDELRDAICEILKEVDFNTATFTDILKRLAKQFDMDLAPRKSSIKLMIQDELTKLADEVDDDGEESHADKDDKQLAGEEVKA